MSQIKTSIISSFEITLNALGVLNVQSTRSHGVFNRLIVSNSNTNGLSNDWLEDSFLVGLYRFMAIKKSFSDTTFNFHSWDPLGFLRSFDRRVRPMYSILFLLACDSLKQSKKSGKADTIRNSILCEGILYIPRRFIIFQSKALKLLWQQ